MLLSWLAARIFGYAMARLRAGDPRVVLALDHPDVQLTFPGQTSFAGVYRGKPTVRRWLERFVACGFAIEPESVVAVGPPWSTTVCALVHVWHAESGYDNRGIIWGTLRWGRLWRYEVFEDTVPSVVVDDWIAAHRPHLAEAVPSS